MYRLKLNAKECISCGICMDLCPMEVLEMRKYKSQKIEGEHLLYLELDPFMNYERQPEETLTFPFMNYSETCNGCMICVDECPVEALEVYIEEIAAEIELISNN